MIQKKLFRITVLFLILSAVFLTYRGQDLFVKEEHSLTGPLIRLEELQDLFPKAAGFQIEDEIDKWSSIFDQQGHLMGRFAVTQPFAEHIRGFGGPIPFIIGIDEQSRIVGLRLLKHSETREIIRALERRRFFHSWDGLNIEQAVKKDIDAVTGATRTSAAVIDTMRQRLRQLSTPSAVVSRERILLSKKDIAAFFLILFACICFFNDVIFRKFKWVLLGLNVIVLGFLGHHFLSLALFKNWLLNGFSLSQTPVLILIFILAVIFPLLTNKKFYCHYLCPLGSLQALCATIAGKKPKTPRIISRLLLGAGTIFLTVIVILLLLGWDVDLSSLEPFLAFSPSIAGLWVFSLAFLVILSSLFFYRPWCRFLCPTGRILETFSVGGRDTFVEKRAVIRWLIIGILFLLIIFLGGRFFLSARVSPSSQDQSLGVKITEGLKEAMFWKGLDGGRVQCLLCPRQCILRPQEKGFCLTRKNVNGRLYTYTYGQPVSLHADPIEKKPFAHVFPGTKSFSLATAGCNLRCKFCQNWEISQLDAEKVDGRVVPAKEIVSMAKKSGSRTIAFTYTEPVVFYEYMLDIAKEAKKQGIDCVMHSAGFINEKPLREVAKYLTAANIDLKGFNEKFYRTFSQGSLQAVLNTLKVLKDEGVWVEVTNLLIPGANDSDDEIRNLCLWIKENLGEDTPIHFARFFPMYKLTNLSPTPLSTLLRARAIALRVGLHYIYIGNIPQQIGEDTYCPVCGKRLIHRVGYHVLENLLRDGKCPYCGHPIAGVWN